MASIAAILAAATHYTGVARLEKVDGEWVDGYVVSGPLGTVAKVDGGEWRPYTPCSSMDDTPRYPCEGWRL